MVPVPKRILAIGVPLATVAVTGVALAYWTTSGSGSGTARTQTAASALTVTQASAPTDMAPGVAAGAITVDVKNAGTSSVRAAQVVVSIASVTPAGAGTCSADDYTLTGAVMTTGAGELAPSATTRFSGATLAFDNDTTANQDGCKGATVNLSYVVS